MVRLDALGPRATVGFVMNHRSNMNDVLVTWIAAQRSALSYAVGEWAQVWPLKALIRALGAYFIHRRYTNSLYRAVLARYVQMSVQEGTTQALFPEGGLSRSGAIEPAKSGLIGYLRDGFDPSAGRDIVFVPVAIAYDRVREDEALVKAGLQGPRRFSVELVTALKILGKPILARLRGRPSNYGHAAVCFGRPLSLSA